MGALLVHENTVFDDETILTAGHAFIGCRFNRCTIVVSDVPSRMTGCTFSHTVWRVELTIHDDASYKNLEELLPVMWPTLVRPPAE